MHTPRDSIDKLSLYTARRGIIPTGSMPGVFNYGNNRLNKIKSFFSFADIDKLYNTSEVYQILSYGMIHKTLVQNLWYDQTQHSICTNFYTKHIPTGWPRNVQFFGKNRQRISFNKRAQMQRGKHTKYTICKQLPIVCSSLLYKIGNYFLDKQYSRNLRIRLTTSINYRNVFLLLTYN